VLRVLLVPLFASAVVAAPAPKEAPRPAVEALKQALGKSHLGKEVRAIGRQLGEDPVIKYGAWSLDPKYEKGQEDTKFYLLWKSKGIDMHFYKGNLTAIWLFNEGADEHKRYRGELPGGLSFEDDRKAIEKKLGKPTDVMEIGPREVAGKEVEDLFLDFPDGLHILLRKPAGGQWAIHYISFQAKDDADK
jgi:hypothetical protein